MINNKVDELTTQVQMAASVHEFTAVVHVNVSRLWTVLNLMKHFQYIIMTSK